MIINKTKDTILAREMEIADNSGKRARGLMFRDSLPENQALLMVFPRKGNHKIWLFGMKFPLDLVFLDSSKRVIEIHENVRPMNLSPKTWKTYCSGKHAKYVLELIPGTVKKTRTVPGDLLDFLI
ncbi:MAG: DUF192 domain-containing protein [Candidatus Aenigmatarchaeota archaeon]|nr:MAG: DUF192 domain-containing protein [Candidatus Aenigmarchaeota archaeon]